MNLTKIKEWVEKYEHDVKYIDALVATLMITIDKDDRMILEDWLSNTRQRTKGKEEIYEKFKRILKQGN